MRRASRWAVLLLVLATGAVLEAIATIEEVRLAEGRDEVNRIASPIVEAAAVPPLVVSVTASFDRDAKIVRRGTSGFFTKGPEYKLGKAVDLAALFGQALRSEAAAIGFRTAESGDGFLLQGTIKDVYLESKQIPYGATLFYGFMDVDWTVTPPGGAPSTRRLRLHNYNGGYNAGMGRKDEAMVALAHLLVEGAQETLARFNRDLFKAPPASALLAKGSTVTATAPSANELHLLGLVGDSKVASAILARLPAEPDENRRSALIETLGRMGAADAVGPLASRFAAEDEDCRWYTIKALDYIGGEAALAAIRTHGLADKDVGPRRLAERITGSGKS